MKTLFSSIINIDYTDQGLNCGGLSYQVSQGMGNHQVWTTRWRYRAGWESLFKVESVVFAVMLMEMLNQDSTKMEENMEKESLLHNISQGSNLPWYTNFLCNKLEFLTSKKPGQVIQTSTQITAHHKGFVEFKLCPRNDETMTGDELQVFFI